MTRQDVRRLTLFMLLAPFLLWILLMIVLPHLGIFALSLREKVAPLVYTIGPKNYLDFLREPIYWNTLLRTATISILVTALTFLVGFPIAYYIAKIAGRRVKGALFLACLIPLWVSDLVRAYGWMILLRETGVVSSLLQWTGIVGGPVELLYNDATVVVGLVYTVVLFMIVPLASTLEGMDDSLIVAGYNLGGNGFTVMRRIVIPYAMPGIVAGSIIVFMLTAGSYLTPILLGGKNSIWPGVLHHHHHVAGDCRAAEEIRPDAGGSRIQSGSQPDPGVSDHHPAVHQAGPDRSGTGGVPRLLRELQHHPVPRRLRRPADRHDVRPDVEGGIHPRAQRGVATADRGVGDAGAGERVRPARKTTVAGPAGSTGRMTPARARPGS